MKTIIYLIRHSEPLKKHLGICKTDEIEKIRNEKNILSVNGEQKAKILSEATEFKNIDVLYSSHYVRAVSTAKYIAENNQIDINIDKCFGERVFGVNDISEIPGDYHERQFYDRDYKLENGESLNDLFKRMSEGFNNVYTTNKYKNIAILSHGTAICALLEKWCDLKYNKNNGLNEIFFNNKMIFDGNFNAPEVFKLVFDESDILIDIENIIIK
ncbi:MAG: histidine phosphatase family protein [bacterium]